MNQPVFRAKLATLFAKTRGKPLPLPPRLARLYGEFRMPVPRGRSLVFGNFVSTLDGVVSLKVPGHEGGGDISGFNTEDLMVMGLLRAIADVVVVGSGTMEGDPHHMWTGAAICPELATDYARLRQALGKQQPALKVVTSMSGRIDLTLPGFGAGDRHPGRTLILTSARGAKRLAAQPDARRVDIRVLDAPRDPRWATLTDVRRGSSHLFLRYAFDRK